MESRTPTPDRPRRSLRRIPHPHLPHLTLRQVRILRLFLLLSFLSALVLYSVFRSPLFQELMRRKIERVLTAKLGRAVTIGGFDLALVPPSFIVRDITVANDPRGLPGDCFSAEELEVRGVPAFAGNRLDLPKLRIVSPRIVFEIFEDGSTNFSTLAKKREPSTSGGLEVRLQEAVIQKATLRFREWSAQLDVVLQDAAFTGRSGRFSAVTRTALACRKARLRLEDNETLEFELGASATLSPGRAHLDALQIRSPRLTLDASGGIDNLRKPVLALVAAANTDGATLGEIFGVRLPLTGAVRTRGAMRIGESDGYRIRGEFELPNARFGPFPMTGSGSIRVDPRGLLVHVERADYAGGRLEAAIRMTRMTRMTGKDIPFRLDIKGRDLDFEQFFRDIGLPGTGMMARADLDTTLTWGPKDIDHADGAGTLRLNASPDRPSAVKGRHALPLSGGGPLLVEDGKILLDHLPMTTAGGAALTLSGTLALGSWAPDLTLDLQANDLTEAERLAENWYPAIQKTPLTPPLKLGGSGRITARLTRAFDDPRVVGRFTASRFVLRGVPFGEAAAEFTVDRNVATFAPFRAVDAGGSLTVTGSIGWGGALKDHYRLEGLATDFAAWPMERVLEFLDFDLPLSGPVTGRLPLDGETPAVTGRVPLVWTSASIWGQKFDRVEGVLTFEKDRVRMDDVTARLGPGIAKGSGFFRYADSRYGVSLDAQGLAVDSLAALHEASPAIGGVLDGSVRGEGTVGKPSLQVKGTLHDATWDGHPLAKEGQPLILAASAVNGDWTATVETPGIASFRMEAPADREMKLSFDVASLARYVPLLGLPAGAALDGSLRADALVRLPEKAGGTIEAEGTFGSALLVLHGKTFALRAPAGFRVAGGRAFLDRATLVEETGGGGPMPIPASLTLSGSVGLAVPHALDVTANGSLDASLLMAFVADAQIRGRIVLDARASGTLEKPEFSGRIALDGVDWTTAGGTAFESVTGTLLLSGDRITASDLSIKYGGGTIDVAGGVTLEGLRPSSIRINTHLARVRFTPFEGFRVTLSGDLVLLGDTTLRAARGELVFDRALYDRDFAIDLASLLGRRRGAASSAPTSLDNVVLDVRLIAPSSSIDIRNNVARVKLSGELSARGTYGHPLLFGQVEAEEGGRLTIQDQKYELVSGKILFSNPVRIEPFFELEARGTINRYTITIGLSGTPSRLVPRFTSDPLLSDAQIVSLIATGELPTSTVSGVPVGGTGPLSSDESVSKAARELIASLATQAVTSRTKTLFRLDRFQIDPTFSGANFDAPRIMVGKTISKDFSATVSYKLSSSSTSQPYIVTLEYQLSPTAFIQGRSDEIGIISLELRFRQRLR
jgi:translocation and assembly module TamB